MAPVPPLKKNVSFALVASSDPVPPPSSAMVVEPAASVIVPTKLVTKKRK